MYTPHSLIEIYKNSIKVRDESKMIKICGVYQSKSTADYGGFYYDVLKDEATDYQVTLIVPAAYKPELVDDKTIDFEGFITRKIRKDGTISIFANLSKLLLQREKQFSEDDTKRLDIQRKKAKAGLKKCDELIKERLLRNEQVHLTFVTGQGAVTDRDVMSMLKSDKGFYRINQVRTNLSSGDKIKQTLAQPEIQRSDIICLFRGGGQGLEVFNEVGLGEYLLRSTPALISALGHEKDVTLVELIADKKCITPSALGTYLNDINEKGVREKENSEAYLTKMISEKFQLQHKQTEAAYEATIKQLKAKERRNSILVVAALVVGLIIGILISK